MFTNWQFPLAIALTAILTTAGGLWIASRQPRWYTEQRLYALIAVGTGLLLGIAFLEFIPHSIQNLGEKAAPLMIAGLLFILFVESYIAPHLSFLEGPHCNHDHARDHTQKEHQAHEHHHHFISHQAACSAVGCLVVCAFFDGFKMQAAFSISDETGWLTSLGLFFHVLPDGVLAAGIALAGGMSHRRASHVSWLTGASLISGGVLATLLSEWSPLQHVVLPFSAGLLIYVSLIHLLPIGHRHPRGFLLVSLGALLYIWGHFASHTAGHLTF